MKSVNLQAGKCCGHARGHLDCSQTLYMLCEQSYFAAGVAAFKPEIQSYDRCQPSREQTYLLWG